MSQISEANRPVKRSEVSKLRWTWQEMKNNKTAYFMLAPFLLLFIIFTVLPVVLSIFLSLTDFNMLQMPHFLGIENYMRLFLDDEIFILAIQNTLVFAAITGPVSYILALLVAWFINELPPKVRAVVTLIFYAPSISGNAYLIWKTLFSSDSYGWANAVLIKYGILTEPILWFQDADYVMPLCIVVALWTSLGTAFLSFIAGFQTIDRSMYEAAAVDGIKNRWQELWFITLPSMKPQLMFGAVMQITNSLSISSISTELAGFPSVSYAGHTILVHLHDYGNVRYEMGYACTIAVVLFFIMLLCNVLVQKLLRKIG